MTNRPDGHQSVTKKCSEPERESMMEELVEKSEESAASEGTNIERVFGF